jgi:hypothetical protein
LAIFDNFQQKFSVFLKNQVMINILQNLALVWIITPIFVAEFFWRKNLKNHNIGHPACNGFIWKACVTKKASG